MPTQPYSASGERVTTLFTQPSTHGTVEAVRVDYAGESFYESPQVIHTVSGNDSDSEPASIIAFFILGAGGIATVPVAT